MRRAARAWPLLVHQDGNMAFAGPRYSTAIWIGAGSATAAPDFAEFIIGRRFASTRWLHPGYGSGSRGLHAAPRILQAATWPRKPATSPRTAATSRVSLAALATLWVISPVAAFCWPSDAATAEAWVLISCMRPVMRPIASTAPAVIACTAEI